MISGETEVNLFSQNHLILFFPMFPFDPPENIGKKRVNIRSNICTGSSMIISKFDLKLNLGANNVHFKQNSRLQIFP